MLVSIALIMTACQSSSTAPVVKQMSQVETRVIQTREYEGKVLLSGMKAVIGALQDEGYLVNVANELRLEQEIKMVTIECFNGM